MITYRFATAADVRAFEVYTPFTLRAVVILVDGVCMGIIALIRNRERWLMCSEFKPAFEPYLKSFTVLRAAKLAMSMLKHARGPVYALADNKPLLERLGFVPCEDDMYRIEPWHS